MLSKYNLHFLCINNKMTMYMQMAMGGHLEYRKTIYAFVNEVNGEVYHGTANEGR